MCSIIGQTSDELVGENILEGLKKMEYRGYDSAGIAVVSKGKISITKEVGKVQEVNKKVDLGSLNGFSGIGHTRWATHGGVTKENAHPHLCDDGSFAVVHNGIIENYGKLKQKLENEHYVFKSQTDTEVIPNLLSYHYAKTCDIKEAILETVKELEGNYSFVAMSSDGQIIGVKHFEPLILGIREHGCVLASDLLGFDDTVEKIVDLDNKQFVMIRNNRFRIYNFEGKIVDFKISQIPTIIKENSKGKFEHFTLKEIMEQKDTILSAGYGYEKEIQEIGNAVKTTNPVFSGSGTSYYAGLVAQYLFPMFTENSISIIKSSETKFCEHFLRPESNIIAISQSGESADVLESVDIAERNNMSVMSVVNSTTSSLTKRSKISIGLNCGPEIGVAATKSFTSQLAIFYKIADYMSGGRINPDFAGLASSIRQFLKSNNIENIAKIIKDANSIYVLGRGIHYPIAMEGSLKIKELSYIHAEGYSTGELKHGPLSLMDKSVYVIVICPEDETFQENLSNIHEIKARGAKVIGISNIYNDMFDYFIEIPKVDEIMYPIIEVIPFQLIAYYAALERGEDPDYPRNLAKCVTVK